VRGKKLPRRLKADHKNTRLCEISQPVQRSSQAETEVQNCRFADANLTYKHTGIHLYSLVLFPYTCNTKTQVMYICNTYGYVESFCCMKESGAYNTPSHGARLLPPNMRANSLRYFLPRFFVLTVRDPSAHASPLPL
jgi:hypothetical protein